MACFDKAVQALVKECRRLQPAQGRIARRNARRAVLGAMKALRNAVNTEFPRIDREKSEEEEERYAVEVFTPVERVGKRLFVDRWRRLRPDDCWINHNNYSSIVPKRFHRTPEKIETAVKFVTWLKNNWPQWTFRVRKVGTDDVIMADVL